MSTDNPKTFRDELALEIFYKIFEAKISNTSNTTISTLISMIDDKSHPDFKRSETYLNKYIQTAYFISDMFRKIRMDELK